MPKLSKSPPAEPLDKETSLRIAQRLHDGPCQTFCSAQLLAQVLLRDADRGAASDRKRQQDLADMIMAGVSELHEILNELRQGGGRPVRLR